MRLRQLDAIRGIAAFTVMLHHYVWFRVDTQAHQPALPPLFWISFRCLHFLFAGHEAVLLFFVLSGMVLSGSLVRRNRLAYPGYVLHRICRIYLPYLAALLLAIVACALFRDRVPHWTPWTAGLWPSPPRASLVVQHVVFIGVYPQQFNTVFWSLIVEMRAAFVLPLLLAMLRWLGLRRGSALVALWGLADMVGLPWVLEHGSPVALDLYLTLHYLIFFAVGVLLTIHAPELGKTFLRWAKPARGALLLVAFVAMDYIAPLLDARVAHVNWDLLGGLGSAGVLFSAMHSRRLARVLLERPLLWLGDVSFSLYLCHVTVMLALSALLGGRVPYPFLALIAVSFSLLLAQFLVWGVEEPARKLGRWLDARYAHRSAQQATVT
jgi:peptidoglycan/LPS O-acetylase OafA/YrhL